MYIGNEFQFTPNDMMNLKFLCVLQAIFIFLFAAIALPFLLSLKSAECDQPVDKYTSETNSSKTINTPKQTRSLQWSENGSFMLIHTDF